MLMLSAATNMRYRYLLSSLLLLVQGLYDACVNLKHPATMRGFPANVSTSCFELNKDSMFSQKIGLLVSTRVLLIAQNVFSILALVTTAIMVFTTYYHKALATIPLVLSCLTLPLGIVCLSLYGGFHHNNFALASEYAGRSSLGPGWILELIATIFHFLAMVPSIVDLSVPAEPVKGGRQQQNVQNQQIAVGKKRPGPGAPSYAAVAAPAGSTTGQSPDQTLDEHHHHAS